MVRENRVKFYSYPGSVNVVSAGGVLSEKYSNRAVNGTIQKVEHLGVNYTATGSLWIGISGTNEVLALMKGSLDANKQQYTHTYTNDITETTGSPQTFSQPVINGILTVYGSGLGNATSGTINVYYI